MTMIRMKTEPSSSGSSSLTAAAKGMSIADGNAFAAAVGTADESCRGDNDGMDAGVLVDQLDLMALGLERRLPGFRLGSGLEFRRSVAAAHVGQIGGDLRIELPVQDAHERLGHII